MLLLEGHPLMLGHATITGNLVDKNGKRKDSTQFGSDGESAVHMVEAAPVEYSLTTVQLESLLAA